MEKKSSGVTIPRWGIGVIAGAGVLLVLLLIVLIPRGGSSSSASSGSSASAGSGQQLTHATSSLAAGSCGAGASDDESVMDAAPKGTKWVTTDSGWTGPVSKTAGPIVDSPIRGCFEHSTEGALYAAAWTLLQISDPAVSKQAYAQYVVNGPAWEAPAGNDAKFQIAGYQIVSSSPDRVTVRIAMTLTELGTDWYSADVTMVWQDGDWRMRVPDSASKNPLSMTQVSDTGKFIRWGTV